MISGGRAGWKSIVAVPIGPVAFSCAKGESRIADVSDREVCGLLAREANLTMKKTILLVEDSKFQKRAIEKILHQTDYLVLFAGDGEEALRLAREWPSGLGSAGPATTKIGGEEVLYGLKRDPHTERVPVIIISNLAEGQSVELKMQGAADCLEKSEFLEGDEGDSALIRLIDRVLCDGARRSETERNISIGAGR
jgi:CheY-like chemotaxis protein